MFIRSYFIRESSPLQKNGNHKLELSGLDINRLVIELRESLTPTISGPVEESLKNTFYISNVNSIDERGVLLKLHHSLNGDRILVVYPGLGVWLTKYTLSSALQGKFVARLRNFVERAKLIGIEQPGSERIVFLNILAQGKPYRLVVELFGKGNLILLDESESIIAILDTLRVRHRELVQGRKYQLPPSRGWNLAEPPTNWVAELQQSDLDISRWLGRKLSLPKKYVAEILSRAEIREDLVAQTLTPEKTTFLQKKVQDVSNLARSSTSAFAILDNGTPVEATPFEFVSKKGETRVYNSFVEAVDEVLSKQVSEIRQESSLSPLRRKLGEIEKSIQEQVNAQSTLTQSARGLREFALKLRGLGSREVSVEQTFPSLGVLDITSMGDNLIVEIHAMPFQLPRVINPLSFSSRVFTEAKQMEEKVKAIDTAFHALSVEKEKLENQIMIGAAKITKKTSAKTRNKEWYEKYRWFYTSDGFLAVGGRDSSTNSILVRRHMGDRDVAFHADFHGSPFFLMRECDIPSEHGLKEVAQATVAYSRAWKEGLSSGDAYWVKPSQIKTSAPTGMFLPAGSFLIDGKKNFIKALKMSLGIGITVAEDALVVFGGAPSAVKKNSVAFVVIDPDRTKLSDTAKSIKSKLVGIVDDRYSLDVRSLSLDEFLRALPNGGGKIVSFGRGEQNH